MRQATRVRSYGDAGEAPADDYSEGGPVSKAPRVVGTGIPPGMTPARAARLARRRAVADLTRIGWRMADIHLALGISRAAAYGLHGLNRALAEAAGRV